MSDGNSIQAGKIATAQSATDLVAEHGIDTVGGVGVAGESKTELVLGGTAPKITGSSG